MEIRISRSGGFSGIEEELAVVDTDDLDAERKSALEERLEKADFFSLPSELPMESVGADQFTYSVTVSGARGSHTVSYRDGGTGSSTQPIGDIVEMVLATRPG